MRNKTGLLSCIIIFAVSCFSVGKDLIPRELLFEAPQKINPLISPNGKYLTYLAPIDQVLNLWIRTIGKNDDRPLTSDRASGINKYFWANNNKNILYLQKNGSNTVHLFSIDINNKKTVDLTPFSNVSVTAIINSTDKPDDLLIAMNKDDMVVQDLYKIKITNGDISLVQKNPGGVIDWAVDKNLQVLGAVSSLPNGGGTLMYRDSPNEMWRELLSWKSDEWVQSVNLTKDKKYWILSHNINSDMIRIVKKNVKTLEETVLLESPRNDLGSVLLSAETGYPIAALDFYDVARWKVLDKKYENDFKNIEKIDDTNYFFGNMEVGNDSWLVYYMKQGKPIHYYVYNRKEGKSTFLFSHRPKLEKYDLPKIEPVVIPTRDGLKLPSYIIRPDNAETDPAPMIVYPAPQYKNRFYMEFDTILIWLANRGYTVLVVNYRGLYGSGKTIMNSGKREWGGKIINDIEDAVDWAVKEKIADPERIGIFGHSMGGYVALAATAFSRINFKACVSYSGPVDLISFIKAIPPYALSFLNDVKQYVGDPEKDYSFLKSISPFYNINKIRTPCFIIQGKNDIFVEAGRTYKFAKALKSRRIPITYLELPDEGHGYPSNRDNLHAFTAAAEKFLSFNLGGTLEKVSSREKVILKKIMKIY